MPVVYTSHARLRMRQRNIPRRLVEAAVRAPDRILPSFEGRNVVRKRTRDRTLEVVFSRRRDTIVIITTYWVDTGV